QLDEGWRTQVPGLDESELRALLMAQPRVIGDAGLRGAAERALPKLMAAPTRQRLHVDTTGGRGAAEDLALLPVVQDAVARDRKLKVSYRAPGRETSERTLDPLGLVAKGTTWYLVAGTPDGLRTYRVSRIAEATLLDARCERPDDFDLAAYWDSSTERLRAERPRYAATLRVDPATAD